MEILKHYSTFGLFSIIFIEEAGIPIPIPGDIFIATASALPNSNYLLIVATVTIATILGSTILFTLSHKFGYKLLFKYGKHIKITPDKITKIEKWFKKYGGATILIGRLIPGLRTITPFAAGLFQVEYRIFWRYTILAAFLWANIYYVIGKFFGEIISKLLTLMASG